MNVAIYARISKYDQNTLQLQIEEMQKYAYLRNWNIIMEVKDIGSGSINRPKREELLKAARQRTIDIILVWRLDRWGRSVTDLLTTLQELQTLNVGFISIKEALDLTTPTGRAMAALLAIFAEFERDILRERVKAGIAHARELGKPHGRPNTVNVKKDEVIKLFEEGRTKSEIGRRLSISRTSVRRLLTTFKSK